MDLDDDGLTNAEEALVGTDPRLNDTDGDGLADGVEVNDVGTDPTTADTDGDGADDGSDAFPLAQLALEFVGRRFAVVGLGTLAEFSIAGGIRETDTVEFTLEIEDALAVFLEPIQGGTILEGAGSSRVRVEIQGDRFQIALMSNRLGEARISLIDTAGAGIEVRTEFFEDFERTTGGFERLGTPGVWEWGEVADPPGAASGSRAWATNLTGGYPPSTSATLTTREFTLGRDTTPSLSLRISMTSSPTSTWGFLGSRSMAGIPSILVNSVANRMDSKTSAWRSPSSRDPRSDSVLLRRLTVPFSCAVG